MPELTIAHKLSGSLPVVGTLTGVSAAKGNPVVVVTPEPPMKAAGQIDPASAVILRCGGPIVAGFGGPENGTGVFAQGGGNGGYPVVAQNPPNAPVAQIRAQIRLVPVSLGGKDPNGANVPGEPGDLLAVSGVGLTTASLWFNADGGANGWSQVQGGIVGV